MGCFTAVREAVVIPATVTHVDETAVDVGRFRATADGGQEEAAQEGQAQASPGQRAGGADARAAVELLQL